MVERAGRIAAVAVLAALLVPFVYVVWVSFAPGELLEPPTARWSLRWYAEFFGGRRWTSALRTSAEVAMLSAIGSVAAGLPLAVAVVRSRFRGRGLLSGAAMLPMLVPQIVLAMGLLPLVRAAGLWGTTASLAGAHSLIALPVVFLVLRSALADVDPDLERAARGLGAGPRATFRRVTLPLILPAVLAGLLAAVLLSLNEFVVALFLATPGLRTLPAALWPETRDRETPLVAAASCVTTVVTLLGLGLALRLTNRRFK